METMAVMRQAVPISAHMKIGTKVPVLINLSDGTAVAVAFQVKSATGK